MQRNTHPSELSRAHEHLNAARLELQHALEVHEGAGELDRLTQWILGAVVAITAARRELLSGTTGNPVSSGAAPRHSLEIVP
jgi:hypothetical protein